MTFAALAAQASAQTVPNHRGYTDAQITSSQSSSDPIKTAYSINKYAEETASFQNALKSYFLLKSQSSRLSFDVPSFVRTQSGTWWETTVQKRKTIYLLKFEVVDNYRIAACSMSFSRVALFAGPKSVLRSD